SLHGRELWTMIKRGQIDIDGDTAFEQFYALAG
ncbi:IS6 family transposase, partial [Vibrio mediterranei]|nr:IS6 family transposase [Vibrio mediterranei]